MRVSSAVEGIQFIYRTSPSHIFNSIVNRAVQSDIRYNPLRMEISFKRTEENICCSFIIKHRFTSVIIVMIIKRLRTESLTYN